MTNLSPRETQIVRLVARGMTTRQIAYALGSSYHTVRGHIASVCRKWGVHGDNHKKRIAVVLRAFRMDVADLEQCYRDITVRQSSKRAIELMKRWE